MKTNLIKMFDSFNKDISWNTKFNVLLTLCLVSFGFFMHDFESRLFIGAVFSLVIVLLVEYYLIMSKKYTNVWKTLKLIFIMIIVAMILIGSKLN